jgi:spore maturation protein CgeB
MRIVVFGLTISSTWGNGHATLWRGLCRALARRGHAVTFFERDRPFYAQHRDEPSPAGCQLVLYDAWRDVRQTAARALADADVAMVTSYCPDAREAAAVVLDSGAGTRVFYDLDTPVTLEALGRGEDVPYVPMDGLGAFDLVLSYTGGRALRDLRDVLGARSVAPLYGSVDPDVHRPVRAERERWDLSYIGTYAADRQQAVERLLLEPAERRPGQRFVIAGSQYPGDFPWRQNVFYLSHLPASDHPAFYAASRLTLNVTRGAMAACGYCPSGRLFEAAACGAPIVSDAWPGLETFFEPDREIVLADTCEDVLAALDRDDRDLARLGRAARERTLACHTADVRAGELEALVASAAREGVRR